MRNPFRYLVWIASAMVLSQCTSSHLSDNKELDFPQAIDTTDCMALFFAKKDPEAIACFEHAVDTLPLDSDQALDFLYHIGLTHRYGSDFEQVIHALERFDTRFPVVIQADTDSADFFENALLLGQRLTLGAFALDNVEKIDSSKEAFEKADSVYRSLIKILPNLKPIRFDALAEVYIKLSSYFSYRALPDSTLFYKKKALAELSKLEEKDWRREYQLASQLGMVYEHLVELDSSKKYTSQQIQILFEAYEGDTVEDIAKSFTILGPYYYAKHQYDSALLYLNRAKSWVETHPAMDPNYILHFSNLKLGDIFQLAGDYPRAISTYELAIQYADSNLQRMANAYDKLGPLYLQMGDCESVIRVSDASLEKRNLNSQFADTQQRIINALLNKSMAYLDLGILDSAQQGIKQAEEIFEKMEIQYRTTDIYQAKLFQTKGMYALASKNYLSAEGLARQALEKYRVLYGEKHELIGSAWLLMSKAAFNEQNFSKAEEYAREALQSVLLSSDLPKLEGDIPAESDLVLSYAVLARAYDIIAQRLIEEFRVSGNLALLHNALNQYVKADGYLSSNLSQLATESSILVFRNSWFFLYEEAIKTCLLLHKHEASPSALNKAYEFAEKSKAHLLRQSQQDFAARIEAGLDSTKWREEKVLKNEVAFAKAALVGASSEMQDSLNIAFSQATDRYDSFVKKLRLENSKYYELRYQLTTSSTEEIQKSLSPAQAFIQFFEGDSVLYQFVILPDTTWTRTIPKTQILVERVDSFQHLIAQDPNEGIGFDSAWSQYREYGYALYEELYEPLIPQLRGVKDLILVPDGILMKVPASALLTQADYTDNQHSPFLLHEYAISYEFSGTTYISAQKKETGQALEILGVAPNFSGSELQPLKRTSEGLEKIGQITSGKYLKDRKATKKNVSKYLKDYGILYFATHAQMDTTAPLFSRLAFTPEDLPLDHDRDYLYAYEIYNDTLAAQLTILGACETGIGAYERSEGMISLGRAFAYAGCPSLVMSLWKAQYISTSLDILPGFLQKLSEKQPKGRALQKAKQDFLEKARENGWEDEIFPYAWATFISVGNQSPLTLAEPHKPPFPIYLLFLIGILLILAVAMKKYSRKMGTSEVS